MRGGAAMMRYKVLKRSALQLKATGQDKQSKATSVRYDQWASNSADTARNES